MLTGPQSQTVIAAAQRSPAVPSGDLEGSGNSGERAGSSRETVVAALRVLALPTAATVASPGATAARSSRQIAQIRLNNNSFTAENFGGGGGPGFGGGRMEVIQRGGTGDYHGNFSFDFRDEALTARNAFADNEPPFQQRNINANLSGPFVRDWLDVEPRRSTRTNGRTPTP